MDRRTFMQRSGLGILAGESFACGVEKTAMRGIFARGEARTEVFGPYLEEEAIAVHKKHWPTLLGVGVPSAWR